MRLLVIEHSHIGHRFPYLRMLLPALCELSDQVTLAIPTDSVDTDEYRSQLAPFEGRVEIDAWLPTHQCRATWHKPAEVREAIRRSRADYLYVLKNGKVVEQGTHDELLENRGYYHSLYTINVF